MATIYFRVRLRFFLLSQEWRAGKRSLTVLVTTSILAIGTLAGCASSAESDGYSNVQIVESENQPYMFSATLNGCTLRLFITQDRVWYASILTLANGKTPDQSHLPGNATFESVGKAQDLAANPRFTAYCP